MQLATPYKDQIQRSGRGEGTMRELDGSNAERVGTFSYLPITFLGLLLLLLLPIHDTRAHEIWEMSGREGRGIVMSTEIF
jgi:hypothetical protein